MTASSHHNGKIARLPAAVLQEVNHRLLHHEPGPRLVAWLNGLPEVQAVLARECGGRPINIQNLSNWRRGGFGAWRLRREIAVMMAVRSARPCPARTPGASPSNPPPETSGIVRHNQGGFFPNPLIHLDPP